MIKICEWCGSVIGARLAGNKLIIITDPLSGNYWVFDSLYCAKEFFLKGRMALASGTTTLAELGELEDFVRRKPKWAIQKYSVLVLAKLIMQDYKKAKGVEPPVPKRLINPFDISGTFVYFKEDENDNIQ